MKKVEIGSKVKVLFSDGTVESFQIVYPSDADIFEHKVSNSSPLGKEIFGKCKNKCVTFLNSNQASIKCKIISIQ